MLAESSRQWRCSGIESWNMLSCAPGTVLARPYRAAPGKGLQLTDQAAPAGPAWGPGRAPRGRTWRTQAGDARSAGTRLARRATQEKDMTGDIPDSAPRAATPTNGTWSWSACCVHIFLRRQADPGADDRADQARPGPERHAFSLLHGLAFSLVLRLHGHPHRAVGRPLFAAAHHRHRRGLLEPGDRRLRPVAQLRPDVPGAHWRGVGEAALSPATTRC